MAVLDIAEYGALARDSQGQVIQSGVEPALADQQLAVGGTSAQSAAFNQHTQFVRLHSDVACRVQFGDNPTASATSKRLAAGATEYFGVKRTSNNGPMKVAVITTT